MRLGNEIAKIAINEIHHANFMTRNAPYGAASISEKKLKERRKKDDGKENGSK
jgi:hypothetical protein